MKFNGKELYDMNRAEVIAEITLNLHNHNAHVEALSKKYGLDKGSLSKKPSKPLELMSLEELRSELLNIGR